MRGCDRGSARILCPGNPIGPSSPRTLQGNPPIRAGQGPQALRALDLPEASHQGPALHQGSVLQTNSLGAERGLLPGPAGGRPGVQKGTHNVGAGRAEGLRAAGDQVAAVEWQENLDVVLTVPLEEGGGCKAQTGHQGGPLSTPPQPDPRGSASWSRGDGGPPCPCVHMCV